MAAGRALLAPTAQRVAAAPGSRSIGMVGKRTRKEGRHLLAIAILVAGGAAAPLSVPPSQGPALQRWAAVLRLRGGSTGGVLVSQGLPPRGSQCTQWPVCGLREVLRQGSRVRGALESLDDAAQVWLSHAPPADLERREDLYASCRDAATLAVSRANGRLQVDARVRSVLQGLPDMRAAI